MLNYYLSGVSYKNFLENTYGRESSTTFFAEYPNNAINILSKQNRFIIFPGFLTHRVKPYFGEKPRTSIVLGWAVKDAEETTPIII